jgi:hypothetical protein
VDHAGSSSSSATTDASESSPSSTVNQGESSVTSVSSEASIEPSPSSTADLIESSTSETTQSPSDSGQGSTVDQVESSETSATTEASAEPSLSSTEYQAESSTHSATSDASSEPAASSTADQGESIVISVTTDSSNEPTPSSTVPTSAASTSTEETTPTHLPVKCRILVILDKSYSDRHGADAVDLYKSSMDLASPFFEQDLGFGLDVTYLVDKTNSIIGDDQSQMADHGILRDLLASSTNPALVDYGEFCTHIVVTSRKLTSGSSGVGGGPPCSKAALALVSDVEGTHGKFLIRTTTAHEIGHVFGADHVCFLFI